MTLGLTIFIVVLTLGNIGGALWLLWWTRRSHGETAGSGLTTGHVWDEDLNELNNPLPRWWLWLFIGTVVFGIAYLVLYPGLGSYSGTLGWTARAQHAADATANAARIERTLAPFANRSVPELTRDAAAINVGRNLFLNNCAACHGSDGAGAPGFPNLTDQDWLWGGDPETVVATIANGRQGVMPPWGEVLGEEGVEDVLSYVFSLQDRQLATGNPKVGKVKFGELCAACHGPDARGNVALGTPNLADATWLHGGALATVRDSITKGRAGAMPAHAARLGTTRVKLLAAYVLSLSNLQPSTVAHAASGNEPAGH